MTVVFVSLLSMFPAMLEKVHLSCSTCSSLSITLVQFDMML